MELDAIRWKESSGLEDKDVTDGDDGKAIGPFQIWNDYWKDAKEYNKKLGGTYQDCRKRQYAEDTVRSYMARYANSSASFREVAMMHNGGCGILKRKGTTAYANASAYADIVVRNHESLKAGKTPKNE